MIHYPHNPEVKEFVLKKMREGATVAQIIDLARVGAIGELQEEYVRGVISDYLKPNQKKPIKAYKMYNGNNEDVFYYDSYTVAITSGMMTFRLNGIIQAIVGSGSTLIPFEELVIETNTK
jgi:hypothetical protein